MRLALWLGLLLARGSLCDDESNGREMGLRDEVAWWREWIFTGGGAFQHEFEARMNVDEPFPYALRELVRPTSSLVRVLDVGAGPMTSLGSSWPGVTLQLHAVDPLAKEYTALLAAADVVPAVLTTEAEGEKLTERFPPGSFDLVHSRNALDHALDPPAAIRSMLSVASVGGAVVLEVNQNVAEDERGWGLHRFNFEARGTESLRLWSFEGALDVRVEALAERCAALESLRVDDDRPRKRLEVITAVLRKTRPCRWGDDDADQG
mmetsp:Transcript_12376/g.40734  ORF Transcript_12376/g.40734 Transcript_12376/m.40734 type:complete len:264 (-) Transcript_12376:283-1074(-)